jgi:hypothetical protein
MFPPSSPAAAASWCPAAPSKASGRLMGTINGMLWFWTVDLVLPQELPSDLLVPTVLAQARPPTPLNQTKILV